MKRTRVRVGRSPRPVGGRKKTIRTPRINLDVGHRRGPLLLPGAHLMPPHLKKEDVAVLHGAVALQVL